MSPPGGAFFGFTPLPDEISAVPCELAPALSERSSPSSARPAPVERSFVPLMRRFLRSCSSSENRVPSTPLWTDARFLPLPTVFDPVSVFPFPCLLSGALAARTWPRRISFSKLITSGMTSSLKRCEALLAAERRDTCLDGPSSRSMVVSTVRDDSGYARSGEIDLARGLRPCGLPFAGPVFADRCEDFARAPPVPMGGIRTDSIRRSGDPGEGFDGDFWGDFEGLLTREPAAANSARVDLFVGDGSSS